MDKIFDEHLLIMKATIKANIQEYDEKMKNLTQYLKAIITSNITPMMYHINMSKYSTYQNDSPKAQDPTTVVPDNKRDPPLYSGHYTKIGGMWNLKH